MRRLPLIGGGDVARALQQLAPQDARTRHAILTALGLAEAEPAPRSPRDPLAADDGRARRLTEIVTARASEEAAHRAAPQAWLDARAVPAGEEPEVPAWRLERVRQAPPVGASRASEYLAGAVAIELSDERPTAAVETPPTLFDEGRARSILGISLSTLQQSGDIDLGPVVRSICRGEALTDVPRRLRYSMARGVQLLLDRSEAMTPFLADLETLERQVRATASASQIEVLSFSGSPLHDTGVGAGSIVTWEPYEAGHVPVAGTRVMCVTDLGLGSAPGDEVPATPADWLEFQERVRRAACCLTVLVPYTSSRWPPVLARSLNLLHWDRTTNAARAATVVRSRR